MNERGALTYPTGRKLRNSLLLIATVVIILIGLRLPTRGFIEGVAVSLFPGGALVPLTVIAGGGPVVGRGPPLIVSTSMDAVREKAADADAYCRVPPPAPGLRAWTNRCWSSLRVPSGMLLIATVPPVSDSDQQFAILRGGTLVIRVVDQCSVARPCYGNAMHSQSTYTLLGVPTNRLPHGKVLVELDDDQLDQATVAVELP